MIARIAACVLVVFGSQTLAIAGIALLALTMLGMPIRFCYGLDGSDQLVMVSSVACALSHVSPSETAAALCCWFLGLQLVVCYAIAGIAKTFGQGWRDGSALTGLLSTRVYGNLPLSSLLARHPRFARLAAWSVILFEGTFPRRSCPRRSHAFTSSSVCSSTGRRPWPWGLNVFMLSFLSVYPALWFCSGRTPWSVFQQSAP